MAGKQKLSEAQIWLVDYLREQLVCQVHTEFKFNPDRKWRFDVCVPSLRLAIECDGGKFHGGHRRGKALEADYERQNAAVMDGWRLLRWTNEQVLNGTAKAFLERHL